MMLCCTQGAELAQPVRDVRAVIMNNRKSTTVKVNGGVPLNGVRDMSVHCRVMDELILKGFSGEVLLDL